MNNKSLNLKKTIIAIFCLFFSISLAVCFSANLKTLTSGEKIISVSQTQSSGSSEDLENDLLLDVDWSNRKTDYDKTISLTSKTNSTSSSSGAYHFVLSSTFPENLLGGTSVKVEGSSSVTPKITFSGSSSGTATLVMHPGYTFSAFQIGYVDNSNNFQIYLPSTKTFATNASSFTFASGASELTLTTEMLDPKYSGKIKFKALYTVNTYSDTLLYNEYSANTYETKTVNYKVNTATTISSITPSNHPNNNSEMVFDGWRFNVTNAKSSNYNYSVTVPTAASGTLIVENSTKTFKLSFAASTKIVDIDGNEWWKVTSVQGFGNMTQSTTGGKRPIILAQWKFVYDLMVNNASPLAYNEDDANICNIWTNYENNGATNPSELYGVRIGTNQGTSQFLKIADKTDYNYDFMRTKEYAFYTYNDFVKDDNSYVTSSGGGKYFVFNYGFEVVGYHIKLADGSFEDYLIKNSGKWNTTTSTPAYNNKVRTLVNTVEDLHSSSFSFDDLARTIDEFYLANYSRPTRLAIMPIWQPVNIKVNGPAGNLDEFNFADDYTLNAPITPVTGKTFFSYVVKNGQDEYVIPTGAEYCWNFSNIPEQCFTYSSSSKTYTIAVTPDYLDNIYKLTLTSITPDLNGNYVLNGAYQFATTSISPAVIRFSDDAVLGGGYNYPTYQEFMADTGTTDGFKTWTENYAFQLANAKSTYIAESDRGFGEILGKVHYSTGTVNDKTLSGAESASLWIYLTNDHVVEYFPSFEHDYQTLIFWVYDSVYAFKTSEYKNAFESEIENFSIPQSGAWKYEESEATIDAYYVYSLKLYYETADTVETGVYGSVWDEFYGYYTPLSFDITITLPDKVEGKTVTDWVLDAAVAESFNYSVTSPEGKSYVEIRNSNIGTVVRFNYTKYNSTTKLYYVQGIEYGTGLFIQDDTNPIIKAVYKNTYTVTIINENTKWSTYSDPIVEKENLYGAYSMADGSTEESGGTRTSLKISDATTCDYPFMTSEVSSTVGLSFRQYGEFSGVEAKASSNYYYYVFNYGYYISGWKVLFTYDGVKYSFNDVNSFDNIVEKDNATEMLMAILASKKFRHLAVAADSYFAGKPGVPSITLEPVWTHVKVRVGADHAEFESTTVNYNLGDYYFREDLGTENGKIIAYYKTNSGETISTRGIWNYMSISYNEYTYARNNTYNINLKLYYVDNIYKVNLIGCNYSFYQTTNPDGTTSTYKTYDLGDTNYRFNSQAGSYDNENDIVELHFYDKVDSSYEFVEYAEEPLIDNYIETLEKSIEEYVEGINMNGYKDFDIFNKVYYSSGTKLSNTSLKFETSSITKYIYLANDQSFGQLPTFNTRRSRLIFWKNSVSDLSYITNQYDEAYENEASGLTSVEKWAYNNHSGGDINNLALSSKYIYSAELYYEDNTPENGKYSYVYAQWYGEKTVLSLVDEEGDYTVLPDLNRKPSNVQAFGKWMFNASTVSDAIDEDGNKIYDGYHVDMSGLERNASGIVTGGKIRVYDNDLTFYLDMFVSSQNAYQSHLFYIYALQGKKFFTQDTNQPFLVAKWSRIYDVTLDATNSYWQDLTGLTTSEKMKLYGAYSGAGDVVNSSADFAKTTFKIAHNTEFEYPFMTSEAMEGGNVVSTSFLHSDDWSNLKDNENYVAISDIGYYYVFSYGHYISAWEISCSNVYFTKNSTQWGVSVGTPKSIDMQYLIGTNFTSLSEYAEQADEYFAEEIGNIGIRLVPIWAKANIQVIEKKSASNLLSTTYGSDYVLDNSRVDIPVGQSLLCYQAESNLISAFTRSVDHKMGVWNYQNIHHNKYVYTNSTATIGAGLHVLEVEPVLVDNIYKVNLEYARVVTENKYQLTNCDFTFNSKAGVYDDANSIELTFSDKVDANYSFIDYQEFLNNGGSRVIDNYTKQLALFKDAYTNGIDNDGDADFDIFKKVYYSTTEVGATFTTSTTEVENDTLNVNKTPNFNIYLANGQKTGSMPVFEKDFYTLIFWTNISTHICIEQCPAVCYDGKQFIYLTDNFNNTVHADEVTDGLVFHRGESGVFEDIWYYSDGYETDNSVTFTAHYYRKNYELEVNTKLKGGARERRGYVVITVTDNLYSEDKQLSDTSGKYVIIFENDKIAIYNAVEGSIKNNTNVVNKTNKLESITIYEGSNVEMKIYDQSKDVEAMQSSLFDEMIGYKYSQEIVQIQPIFTTPEADGYTFKATDSQIAAYNYANASKIVVDVLFEKIIYGLSIKIDSPIAGQYNFQANSTFSGYTTAEYKIDNISVGNFYKLNYYAFAGYKLESDAFILRTGLRNVVLKTFDHQNVDKNSQICNLSASGENLDGTWLRTFFYAVYSNYAVDQTNLGVLEIMTEAIVFDYGIKVYDPTDNAYIDEQYIIETVDQTTLKLTNDGKVLTPEVGNCLTNQDYGFYYYNSNEDVNYALLTTRLYFPNKPTTMTDNYYREYGFVLKTKPTNQFELTSYHLAYMVNNYEDGKIISYNDRNIYLMLEVRKLFKIDVYVQQVAHDTNMTARTTTITNGNNNLLDVTVNAGSTTQMLKPIGTTSTTVYNILGETAKLTIFTYYGLENNLSSVYNANHYSSVEYYVNNLTNRLTENKFTTEEDSVVVVKYIPRSLSLEFVYKLNNATVSKETASNYLNDANQFRPTDYAIYYLDDYVAYLVNCTHDDYNLRVTINGVYKGSTDMSNRSVNITEGNRYKVTEADYQVGKIQIVVDIIEKNNSKIQIRYQLADSSKKVADDVYGTFDVIENTFTKLEGVSSAEITVFEGRDVYVKLYLMTGYEYKGIKQGTGNVKYVAPDANGKILLVADYNPEVHTGDYLIIIDKVNVTAVLNASGLKAEYYINGQSNLTGLYVGSTIQFTNVDVAQERLGCFYYTYGTGEGETDVYLTADGTETGSPIMTLKITSALLEEIGTTHIRLGVVAVNRFKLDLNVIGQQYIKQDGLAVTYVATGNAYELGTYCDKGTELKLEVETKVEGKYNININERDYDVIKDDDMIITLNENHAYVLTVEPKTFAINVKENVYTTLTGVQNNVPDSEVFGDDQVNALQAVGQQYNQDAVLEFVRNAEDRQLAEIIITDESGDVLMNVKLVDENYVVEIFHEEYGFDIKLTNYGTVKLTYTTIGNINLRLDYKEFVVIQN